MSDVSFSSLARELVTRSLVAAEPLDPPMIGGKSVVVIRGQLLEDMAEGTGLFDEDDDEDDAP